MPSTLAAPGLRGTPSPRWAHEPIATNQASIAQIKKWANVDASVLKSTGCQRVRLRKGIRKSKRKLDACVHRYVENKNKGSRILFNLSAENQGQPNLILSESTLPNDPLVQCLQTVLEDQLGRQKSSCAGMIRIMIRPLKSSE